MQEPCTTTSVLEISSLCLMAVGGWLIGICQSHCHLTQKLPGTWHELYVWQANMYFWQWLACSNVIFFRALQGTWQFVSAKLTGHMDRQHDFKDDLKSSIYVLLWVALMYSDCSNWGQVPSFMEYASSILSLMGWLVAMAKQISWKAEHFWLQSNFLADLPFTHLSTN